MTAERIASLREEVRTDRVAQGLLAELSERAETYLLQPPPEHRVEGRRLLAVARRVVAHVLAFALLARITGEDRYIAAARREMLHAAAFPDWNPSHFLDTAEMATALSCGYDWLYDSLSFEDRSVIEQALLDKALRPMLSQEWFWFKAENNWNSVCHAGCTLAALAVMERAPDVATAVLELMRCNIGRVAASYGPDGAYDEGPMYWDYGTTFLVLLCSAMGTATGEPFDPAVPGLDASVDYMRHVIGPSGDFYNYSDCRLRRSRAPALFWFAGRLNRSSIAAVDRAHYAGRCGETSSSAASHEADRVSPLALIWHCPATEEVDQPNLFWIGGGRSPVALMRTAWNDSGAAFLGIKGGSPRTSHGHMDVGSFVYENAGVRWAIDLPLQDYHSLEVAGLNLWNNDQNSDRWRVFRLGPDGHGILRMDGAAQTVEGFAPLEEAKADDGIGSVTIDLKALYGNVTRLTRNASLGFDGCAEFVDRWQLADRSARVSWQMLTLAAVEVVANGFTLRHDGQMLRVEFSSTCGGVAVTAVAADTLTALYDAPNPGVTRLVADVIAPAHEPHELRTHLSLITPRT